jgi:hypothetical protein
MLNNRLTAYVVMTQNTFLTDGLMSKSESRKSSQNGSILLAFEFSLRLLQIPRLAKTIKFQKINRELIMAFIRISAIRLRL